MTVLFKVDWDSGSYASNVYTMATPEVPNAHTFYNFPNDALFSESASPWNGQWLASLGLFWYTRADSDVTSATVQATSGRILFQMVPPTASPNSIFKLSYNADPGAGNITIKRTSGGNLTFDFGFNNSGSANFYDYGACPTTPVNVEVIYDGNNATAVDRMKVRVWAVGGSPGAFNSSATASGSAGTSAQFDLLHLSDGGNDASGIRFGKIFVSDDITEDLSALLGGANYMPLFMHQYKLRRK